MTPAEICDKQNEIIKAQSDIIDDLFLQVIQYASIEEEEKVLDKIENVQKEEVRLWRQYLKS